MSSRAIEQTIRNAGISVSRSRTILPLMREIQAVEKRGANVRHVARSRSINVARLPESLTPLRRKYSYTVRVRGINSLGKLTEQYLQYSTNSSTIKRETIENRVAEIADTGQSGEALQDVDVTLVHGMRASGTI